MSDEANKTIELARSEWSEVTVPATSKMKANKKRKLSIKINLIVGLVSAFIGFMGSDIDQDMGVDIDLELSVPSTTARIASDELVKRDVSNASVSGFRISVVNALAQQPLTSIAEREIAFLSDVFTRP